MGTAEEQLSEETSDEPAPSRPRVAYIVSRFPEITETFVLREIVTVRRRGIEVLLFPLMCLSAEVEHPEVEELRPVTTHLGVFTLGMVSSMLANFARAPLRTVRTLARALIAHRGSRRALFGTLAILPKCVHLARLAERLGVTHIHAHFANHPATAAWVIHELTGIPYTFTAHGSDIHRDQSGLALKLEGSRATVTISEYNRQFIAERCGARFLPKVRVVHCGIDCDYFRPAPRRENAEFRILCVAAMRGVKGHRYLLEACARLRDAGVVFRLELVGDGPIRREVEARIAALGLESHVVLAGSLPAPEVRRRMLEADVVALTSIQDEQGRREGIPVTLMEAMSCEVPVVASRISGIPELVEDGETGLLPEPGDSEGIARALLELGADPVRRAELGRRGRQKVLREFHLEECAGELVSIFEEFARAPGRALAAPAARG